MHAHRSPYLPVSFFPQHKCALQGSRPDHLLCITESQNFVADGIWLGPKSLPRTAPPGENLLPCYVLWRHSSFPVHPLPGLGSSGVCRVLLQTDVSLLFRTYPLLTLVLPLTRQWPVGPSPVMEMLRVCTGGRVHVSKGHLKFGEWN